MLAAVLGVNVLGVRLVVGVAVEGLVGDNVVFEKSLEVFLTVLAEQEGVDPGSKLLEGEVGRSKERATSVVSAVQGLEKTSLDKTKLKSRELARQEIDDGKCLRRRKDKVVNTVDNTVGAELKRY